MDVQALKISFVREGAEIAERAARAQADRGPDPVPDEKIEPAAGLPDERHAQPETAADRLLLKARPDRPDVDEQDVPVRFAAGRPVEAPRDVDVASGFIRTEGVGLIFTVVDGQAGGARGGDGGDEDERGRAVGAAGEKKPPGPDEDEGQPTGQAGWDGEGRGRGDAEGEGGRQEKKGKGAGS